MVLCTGFPFSSDSCTIFVLLLRSFEVSGAPSLHLRPARRRQRTSIPPSGSSRTDWLKTLDQITALKPAVVIPGHQVPGAKNDLSAIEFMKKYMQDWDRAVAASRSADELREQMKKLYPDLGMENLMNSGATAAFQPARGR